MIEVRLYASLRQEKISASDGGVVTVDVPDGISLAELLEEMEMDPLRVKTATINGVGRQQEFVLNDGDRVALYPPDFVPRS